MSYQFRNITVLVVESTKAMFDLTKSVLTAFGVNQVYSAYGFDEGFDGTVAIAHRFQPLAAAIHQLEIIRAGFVVILVFPLGGPLGVQRIFHAAELVVVEEQTGVARALVEHFQALRVSAGRGVGITNRVHDA